MFLFSSFVVPLAAEEWGCHHWNTKEYFSTATIQNVKGCLEEEGVNVAAARNDGYTPLHLAAEYNKDPAVVQALLAHGANLNAKTADHGHTPLHVAAFFNPNLEVLQALLAAGADPMVRGADPMELVVYPMMLDKDKFTPLQVAAAYSRQPGMVRALLAAGADLNARDDANRTPLHLAARSNRQPGMARALLAAGADLNARDDADRTPLHLAAAYSRQPGVVRRLLAAGADLNARDDANQTPLELAASNESSTVIQPLVAAGAGPEARYPVKIPFMQTFLQLDMTEKKLAHLKSWNLSVAEDQGISEDNTYRFETVLKMFVFPHVVDKGVLDCEAMRDELLSMFPKRHDFLADGYVMFNAVAAELCPETLLEINSFF